MWTCGRKIDVEQLLGIVLHTSEEQWESYVRHEKQIQSEDFTKEMAKVKIINTIIINLRNYSNDEDLAHRLSAPKVNSALHSVSRLEPAKEQTSTHTHTHTHTQTHHTVA
jgi:hypothetical protein